MVRSAVAVDLVCWTSVTTACVLASDSVGSAESSDHVEVLWATVISFDRGRDSVGPDSYWTSDSAGSDYVEVLWPNANRCRQRLASRGDSVGSDSCWKRDSAAGSEVLGATVSSSDRRRRFWKIDSRSGKRDSPAGSGSASSSDRCRQRLASCRGEDSVGSHSYCNCGILGQRRVQLQLAALTPMMLLLRLAARLLL